MLSVVLRAKSERNPHWQLNNKNLNRVIAKVAAHLHIAASLGCVPTKKTYNVYTRKTALMRVLLAGWLGAILFAMSQCVFGISVPRHDGLFRGNLCFSADRMRKSCGLTVFFLPVAGFSSKKQHIILDFFYFILFWNVFLLYYIH